MLAKTNSVERTGDAPAIERQQYRGKIMNTNRIKFVAIIAFALPLIVFVAFRSTPTRAASAAIEDPGAVYKAKCQMCHTPTATKFYDATRPEDEQIDAILKGKKGEKPPYMPAFADKGITADDAKALAGYMKSVVAK